MFDLIYIAIGVNTSKQQYFDLEKRKKHIESLFANHGDSVKVVNYSNLTVDLCFELQAKFIVRGLRNTTDFEYEQAIAQMNQSLNDDIKTVFFTTEPMYSAINSTIVREIHRMNGDVSAFVTNSDLIV